MLSVPTRWLTSPAKRNLPSPKTRNTTTADFDTSLTDIHVDPVQSVSADADSDTRPTPDNPSEKETKSALNDEGKGTIIDRSV